MSSNKKIVNRFIVIISFSVFIISLYTFGSKFYKYYDDRAMYKEIEQEYKINNVNAIDDVAPSEILADFKDLLSINSETIGWIKIGNTNINYPVVQASNNDFYLTNNFKKENSQAGCIFMDFRNSIEPLDKNIILYGHNMKDSSMFRDLTLYGDEDFLVNNKIISFDTLYLKGKWEVFSFYVTDINYDYLITDFKDNDEYENYINSIVEKSQYKSDVKVTAEDKILTLSTCSFQFENARAVVHAKLISN